MTWPTPSGWLGAATHGVHPDPVRGGGLARLSGPCRRPSSGWWWWGAPNASTRCCSRAPSTRAPTSPSWWAVTWAAASRLTALASFGRSSGWVAPLSAGRITEIGVDSWARTVDAIARELWRDGPGLVLSTPQASVRDQQRRATSSAGRFRLLASSTAVLLLGTAVVGGVAVRADHAALLAALRRRGGRRGQLRAASAIEVGAVATSGLLAGSVSGTVAAGVIAWRSGIPVPLVVTEALSSGLPIAVAASVLGAALTAAALRGRARSATVAGAALACGVGAVLVASRGGVGPEPGDPLVSVLPALVLLTTGLGLTAAWPSLAAGLPRLVPRRAVAARLGMAAVAGRAVRPAATAGLLAAALAATTFAIGYRATLDCGAADQAAFAVPAQAVLTARPAGRPPQDVASPAELVSLLGERVQVDPVLRATASLRGGDGRGEPVQLVGLPPAALTRVDRWGEVTGSNATAAELAAAISIAPARLPTAPAARCHAADQHRAGVAVRGHRSPALGGRQTAVACPALGRSVADRGPAHARSVVADRTHRAGTDGLGGPSPAQHR